MVVIPESTASPPHSRTSLASAASSAAEATAALSDKTTDAALLDGEVEITASSSGVAAVVEAPSSRPPDSSSTHLIRHVRTGKFLDAATAAVHSKDGDDRHDSTAAGGIYLQSRNGQPTQEFVLDNHRIVNTCVSSKEGHPPSVLVLTAVWSTESSSYTRAVAWSRISDLRDADADETWDVAVDGTLVHRATGQVLGLGTAGLLSRNWWRGPKLHLYPRAPHDDLQQWQLLPVHLVQL